MRNSVLDSMIEENQFPIIFIGAGIPKRYLEDYPSWSELLKFLWDASKEAGDFYGYLNRIRNDILTPEMTNSEIDYYTNIAVASDLEAKINSLFYEENLNIENFNQEMAYKTSLSPLKRLLANKFSNYKLKEKTHSEYIHFKNMLQKAQIILTTNYDTLIQDSYKDDKNELKTYIGQKGFFEQTIGYAELYKLHGCTNEPNTLVITKDDYDRFNKNSILISAKIISMLLHSPIIFLGYSLTDVNVRKIIKDFVQSLSSEELAKLENRLIVVEYKKSEVELIEEKVNDSELNCRLTVIKTDNFLEIYKKIGKIDQGVAPAEVRRYQQVIKELIVSRGKEGTLNSLLISPDQLDDLERLIGNKNLIVAIGDQTIIYAMPDTVGYISDYMDESKQQNIDIMLRFIAKQAFKTRIPFARYATHENINNSSLYKTEKEKLFERIKRVTYDSELKRIKLNKIHFNNLDDIIKQNYKIDKEQGVISYNIDDLDLRDVEQYIKIKVKELKESQEEHVSTSLRQLILLYDLRKHRVSGEQEKLELL